MRHFYWLNQCHVKKYKCTLLKGCLLTALWNGGVVSKGWVVALYRLLWHQLSRAVSPIFLGWERLRARGAEYKRSVHPNYIRGQTNKHHLLYTKWRSPVQTFLRLFWVRELGFVCNNTLLTDACFSYHPPTSRCLPWAWLRCRLVD